MSGNSVPTVRTAGPATVHDRAARGLLVLLAVAALAAMGGAVATVAEAGETTRVVETWRMFGFGVFAGMFLLLAYRPRHYAGIWELAIVNKLGLTLAALAYGTESAGTAEVMVADGGIASLLVAAYVLSRGWRAWLNLG